MRRGKQPVDPACRVAIARGQGDAVGGSVDSRPGSPASGEGAGAFTLRSALRGARLMLPVAVSVFAYGSVYGVLARQTGVRLAEALALSGLVYAGSAQLVVLDLWQAPLPAATIVLTTLIVNLRHLLMGAAVQPWFRGLSRARRYGTAFLMADENWALSVRELQQGRADGAVLLGSGLVCWAAWMLATLAGHTLGAAVVDPARWGLDFAFLAVFLALIVGMARGKRDLVPWAVAAGVAILAARMLPGKWYILLGGLAGSLVGAVLDDGA